MCTQSGNAHCKGLKHAGCFWYCKNIFTPKPYHLITGVQLEHSHAVYLGTRPCGRLAAIITNVLPLEQV